MLTQKDGLDLSIFEEMKPEDAESYAKAKYGESLMEVVIGKGKTLRSINFSSDTKVLPQDVEYITLKNIPIYEAVRLMREENLQKVDKLLSKYI